MHAVSYNAFTEYSRLDSFVQPINSTFTWLESASYQSASSPITIWMTGYLAPAVTSDYLFSLTLDGNGFGKFYLSDDSSSANKVNC